MTDLSNIEIEARARYYKDQDFRDLVESVLPITFEPWNMDKTSDLYNMMKEVALRSAAIGILLSEKQKES